MSKKLLPLTIFAALSVMYSCGSKDNTQSTGTPQSMVADTPKDDGQGVGKFKNITLAALDEKLAEQGKAVFETKCATCHNTTDVKKTGPGLKGVTQRRQPAWILNQITNPQEMTQKDPTAKELLATYLTQMTFQDVSDDQAKQLLEFLRKNDSGEKETAQSK